MWHYGKREVIKISDEHHDKSAEIRQDLAKTEKHIAIARQVSETAMKEMKKGSAYKYEIKLLPYIYTLIVHLPRNRQLEVNVHYTNYINELIYLKDHLNEMIVAATMPEFDYFQLND